MATAVTRVTLRIVAAIFLRDGRVVCAQSLVECCGRLALCARRPLFDVDCGRLRTNCFHVRSGVFPGREGCGPTRAARRSARSRVRCGRGNAQNRFRMGVLRWQIPHRDDADALAGMKPAPVALVEPPVWRPASEDRDWPRWRRALVDSRVCESRDRRKPPRSLPSIGPAQFASGGRRRRDHARRDPRYTNA